MNRLCLFSLTLMLMPIITPTSCAENRCDYVNPCRCQFNNKNAFLDLNGISNPSGDPFFKDVKSVVPGEENTYSYNPCKGFNEGNCTDSIICKHFGNTTKSLADKMGLNIRMTGDNVTFVYIYEGSTSFVDLVCDEKAISRLEPRGVVKGTMNHYSFVLTTAYACPNYFNPSSNGISAGSVMLIIFFVFIVIYIIGGVVDGKCRRNAVGVEVFPNYEFWAALPGLIKDGIGLTVTCSCFAPKKASYDGI